MGKGAKTVDAAMADLVGLSATELLDLAAGARAVGFAGPADGLDTSVSPRGYRLLTRVPRLPGAIIDRLVEHFDSLQRLLAANIEDLMAVEGVGESRARAVSYTHLDVYKRQVYGSGSPNREVAWLCENGPSPAMSFAM